MDEYCKEMMAGFYVSKIVDKWLVSHQFLHLLSNMLSPFYPSGLLTLKSHQTLKRLNIPLISDCLNYRASRYS